VAPFLYFVLGLTRRDANAPGPAADAMSSEPSALEQFAFFATQQCLAAQSARMSNLDAALGVLVLVQLPIVLYLFDKAVSEHQVALFVLTALMLVPMALAFFAATMISGDESPEATLFNAAGLPAGPFRTDDWPFGKGK